MININNLFSNTNFVFQNQFFLDAPLSKVYFVLTATIVATDARHFINAYYFICNMPMYYEQKASRVVVRYTVRCHVTN